MKKYLMMGAAALMMGASFTSCSNDKDLYDPTANAQKFLQDYQAAFISVFGQPAANQTWGFGDPAASRMTRAGGDFANYVGAYPDANMWTSKGFLAPDPLTKSQKLRAQYYFQMNKITNPNRPDYGTRDFFMQQVYDGFDDPMPGKSFEQYPAASSTDNHTDWIQSGEHMDHLTCGPDHTHTYNFNNGNCSTNGEVADRDQTNVNDTGKQHKDQIQLMLNTKTSCFGYANSDASFVRDDRWTLVSAAAIDAFCDGDAGFKTWLAARLPSDEQDVKCDDDFHRDFIGFDFDMLPDDNIFAYNYENGKKTTRQTLKFNVYSNEFAYIKDGNTLTPVSGVIEPTLPNSTKGIPMISANTNQYCGTAINLDDKDLYIDIYDANNNNQYLGKALNIGKINELVADGYLPNSSNVKNWIKVGGCADGYYSDWIVTFMPADSGDEPKPETMSIRIMAEDVAASAGSDIDFNDLVFDVEATFPVENGAVATSVNKVFITIQAAGGTMPIYINGVEAHGKLGLIGENAVKTMVNTNAEAYADGVNYFFEDNVTPVKYELTISDGISKDNFLQDVNEKIKITLQREGSEILVLAQKGEPTAKIAVPVGTPWAKEKVNMGDAFRLFREWVNTTQPEKWYNSKVDGMVMVIQ